MHTFKNTYSHLYDNFDCISIVELCNCYSVCKLNLTIALHVQYYYIIIGMAVEVWSKSRRCKPVFPIESQKHFCTIFPG